MRFETFYNPRGEAYGLKFVRARVRLTKKIRKSLFGILEVTYPYAHQSEFQLAQVLPGSQDLSMDYLDAQNAYLVFAHREQEVFTDLGEAKSFLARMKTYPEEFTYRYR